MGQKLNGKKLLVLGGAFQHCKVVNAAQELGMVVYVADYLPDSPAKKIADYHLDIDVKNADVLIDYCKKEKIDGVINLSLDPCQIPYQKICEALGYPCFGNQEQFKQLTNKEIFKSLCKKYDVDIIPSYSFSELKDCDDKDVYPVIVKPVDSRGSRGQTVCYHRSDLSDAVRLAQKESSNGEIIIEKFLTGKQDFTVAYLISNGIPYIVRTGDRYVGESESNLDKVAIISYSPSLYTDMYLKHSHPKMVHMLSSMGLQNAAVFFQGFIDGEVVRFYDPGLRFSGGEYEQLFKLATGIDLVKIVVEFAVTGEMNLQALHLDDVYLNGNKIMQICPALKSGMIAHIGEDLDLPEDVVTYNKRYHEGDFIPDENSVSRRFAEICVLSKDQRTETQNLTRITDTLTVKDANGNEMICTNETLNEIQKKRNKRD